MLRNKKKWQAGGFSLVEIMVAIAILAIITVPMMGYFVDSTKRNARSKEVQEAMTAGQTVMEEVKTQTVEALWNSAAYQNLLSDGITVAPAGPFVEENLLTGSPYHFRKKIRSGDKDYDVYISLDPKGSSNKYVGVNQTDMAYMPEAAGTDVVTIVQDVQDNIATNMYVSQHQSAMALLDPSDPAAAAIPSRTADFIQNNITKHIAVNMDYTDPSMRDTIQVDVTYQYEPLNNDIYGVATTDLVDLGTDSYTVATPTGSALSVYFFYDALPGAEEETITVQSNLGLSEAMQFYLICQEDGAGRLPHDTRNYYMTQQIMGIASDVNIRSNVKKSLTQSANAVIEKIKPQRLFQFNLKVYQSGDVSRVLAEYDSAKGVWKDD